MVEMDRENPVIEALITLLERAAEGDKRAVEDFKEAVLFIKEILSDLGLLEEMGDLKDISELIGRMSDEYERYLLEVFRAVG